MAEQTLFQALISSELRERAERVQKKFRLNNTDLLSLALELACAKLETLDDPLEAIAG